MLAQAFILIDVLLEEIIKPVNLCYQLSDKTERVKAQVHTTLFEHIDEQPTIEQRKSSSLLRQQNQIAEKC